LRLNVLARVLRNNFDRDVSALGVTRSQWAMIAVVFRDPGAMQRQIADVLEMSEASAGRLIDRLCADGLLERQDKQDDRRAKAVYVTDAAKPLLEQLSEIATLSEERIFDGFSKDELDSLKLALDRIYENINK